MDAMDYFGVVRRYCSITDLESVLEAAGADNVPPLSRSSYSRNEAEWFFERRVQLSPHLLRLVDPEDDDLPLFVDRVRDLPMGSERQLVVAFRMHGTRDRANARRVGLTQLAASSMALYEVFVHVAAAWAPLGILPVEPQVSVSGGSVNLTVGGSLFASGLALIVACSSGAVGAPLVGTVAGAALTVAGSIDLVLGWRDRIEQTRRARVETRKIERELGYTDTWEGRRLRALRLERLEAQVGLLRQELSAPRQADPPASSLVPRAVVRDEAERLGLSEAHSTHLLNRGLRPFHTVRMKFDAVETEWK